jgi:hypothetical protein
MSEKIRCTWDGCWRSSKQPYADGWAHLMLWGPGVPDGFYCKPHADAIDAVLGGADEPDDGGAE